MIDNFGRKIDYVRISVTDRCNLRCIYCMPEEGIKWMSASEILSYEEILQIVNILADLGIHKVKITGGEPLVRKDVSRLIRMIKDTGKMESITLTTNGILLGQQMEQLVNAGLDGVNISLDTLNPQKYTKITRGGDISCVRNSIEQALTYPDLNVKINCVLDCPDKEDVIQIANLAKNHRLSVRFIELMPIGLGKGRRCMKEDELLVILQEEYGKLKLIEKAEYAQLGNGPAHYYQVNDFMGNIGFISAISHQFCSECNRIRLTANGYLKTCLQYENGIDVKRLLRENQNVSERIKQTILEKPKCHHFMETDFEKNFEQHPMSQIGG